MKLLFFDIDGTLLDPHGQVPQSAIDALKQAQANGHKTFLCSGRSYNQIPDTLINLDFDGVVAATGSYVVYQGKEILHDIFGEERFGQVMDIFKGTKTGFLFQASGYCLTSPKYYEQPIIRAFDTKYGIKHLKEVQHFSVMDYDDDIEHYPQNHPDVEALIYNESPFTVDELREMVPDSLNVELASFKKPEPYSGEITLKNNSKGSGMELICKQLGMTKEDIISFGDGPNDFGMFEASGYSVAMGNAMDSVKEAADYVTDSVTDDGLMKAMKHLGLI